MKAKYKVADVIRMKEFQLDEICSNSWKLRTLQAIKSCRTADLGGHIDNCSCCNRLHMSYNSCRNRHCPNCQGHKREEWIQSRNKELLPVPYFHVVFTIPSELNALCLKAPQVLYNALFKSAWATIVDFSKAKKPLHAKTGMIAVLHTWGQNLSLHPHLHCIIPGGGVTKAGFWKKPKGKGKFLFPIKAMSKVFRAKFVAELRASELKISQDLYDDLFKQNWVVFAKKPFKRPENVIEYLGRYTHKIAISNHRILSINEAEDKVSFSLKNYKKGGKQEVLKLRSSEFIRRFSLHVLPKGFTRIRHYGILSGTWKSRNLKDLQIKLGSLKRDENTVVSHHRLCPNCKKGRLSTVICFDKRGPPSGILKLAKQLIS